MNTATSRVMEALLIQKLEKGAQLASSQARLDRAVCVTATRVARALHGSPDSKQDGRHTVVSAARFRSHHHIHRLTVPWPRSCLQRLGRQDAGLQTATAAGKGGAHVAAFHDGEQHCQQHIMLRKGQRVKERAHLLCCVAMLQLYLHSKPSFLRMRPPRMLWYQMSSSKVQGIEPQS